MDVAIPCNNKSRISIGLLWWLLCREVLYLRNTPELTRGQDWNVMIDLFIYRDPEEDKEQQLQPAPEEVREDEQNAEIVTEQWNQNAENWSAPQEQQFAAETPVTWGETEGSYE